MQERFVAGSLAGATAQTIIYPMEVRRGTLTEAPPQGGEACNNHSSSWCDKHWDYDIACP